MTKKAFPIGVTLAVAALLFVALLPVAAGSDVTYCHATPADTAAGGWNAITTDDAGALPSSSHAEQHDADIIPPASYYTCPNGWEVEGSQCTKNNQAPQPATPGYFPGKNLATLFGWGATGQQVLDNGCVLPPPPYVPCSEQVAGTPPATQEGEWSAWAWNASQNQFVRSRSVTTYTAPVLDARDSSVVCVPAVPTVTTETERKGAFQVIWSSGESTCDSMLLSWGATLVPEADPSLFKVYVNGVEVGTSGNSEAYGKDSYTLTFYYDGVLQTTHGPYSWVKPQVCYTQCTNTVVQDWAYMGDAYDVGAPVWGPWVNDGDGTFSRTGTQATGWDQYQHTVDAYNEAICSTAYRTVAGSRTVTEDDEACPYNPAIRAGDELCAPPDPKYTTDFDYDYHPSPTDPTDCSGWWGELKLFRDDVLVLSDYKAGLWSKPYELETSGELTFTVTDGDYSYSEKHTFTEPEECQQLHETGPWYTESCEGYEYGYVLDGQHVKTGDGKWANSFKAEEVTVQVYVPETQETFSIYIGKEEECLECKWTAVYPMSIYQPANPPQSYWHGPFSFSACAVIHDADEVPSADRVTMVCSLCPDQIEGGFIFNALNKPYTGYLWRVECYGKGVTFVFADDWHEFEWDEDWVRKGYTDDGHRCEDNPRIAGCSAWIHEQANIPYWDPLNPEGSQ